MVRLSAACMAALCRFPAHGVADLLLQESDAAALPLFSVARDVAASAGVLEAAEGPECGAVDPSAAAKIKDVLVAAVKTALAAVAAREADLAADLALVVHATTYAEKTAEPGAALALDAVATEAHPVLGWVAVAGASTAAEKKPLLATGSEAAADRHVTSAPSCAGPASRDDGSGDSTACVAAAPTCGNRAWTPVARSSHSAVAKRWTAAASATAATS